MAMTIRLPHVFVLLTMVIMVVSALTWVIPSGQYERVEKTIGDARRTIVVPGTYAAVPRHRSVESVFLPQENTSYSSPVSLIQMFSSIPRGMTKAADIIFLIFIIGGVLGIIQRTGAITGLIYTAIQRYGRSGPLLTVILLFFIGVSASTLGMGEEFIPLIPIFMYLSHQLGYDKIYGVAIVLIGAEAGFAAATTNPFTVQIAQGIAEIPLGQDIVFRIVFFGVIIAVCALYLLWYGRKVYCRPTERAEWGGAAGSVQLERMNRRQAWAMAVCGIIFAALIIAMQFYGWWLAEMSAGFLIMGVLTAIICRLSIGDVSSSFVKGMEEMVVPALVVGFAKGIQVVMEDGMIMDTIIHHAAGVLEGLPRVWAAEGMLVFQSSLNFFIPSGSGQAAATMPLMTPLADLLGISRQTAVFAFTCGDGFSNLIIPTSSVLMAMLAIADVPYGKWLRFILPLFVILMILSGIFLAISVYWNIA